jgi:hypothetical protein
LKNALAYHNAGVVVVNTEVAGLALPIFLSEQVKKKKISFLVGFIYSVQNTLESGTPPMAAGQNQVSVLLCVWNETKN